MAAAFHCRVVNGRSECIPVNRSNVDMEFDFIKSVNKFASGFVLSKLNAGPPDV